MNKRNRIIFSTEAMLKELDGFDPITFKYYYENSQKEIKELIQTREGAQRYSEIVEYEKSHQFSSLTKRNYADDYANLNLVYGRQEDTLRNINMMETVLNKIISQYINIEGMERLFSETYIEFEWEMHLSADYKKHNMNFYRDHFFHQIRDMYMMYILLRDQGFYEHIRKILLSESESKVSRFVSRCLIQQKYYDSEKIFDLRKDDDFFYIRNMIYMATFMAGLFHDIGYPESYYKTTSRHIRDYIASIHELNAEGSGINKIYSLLQNSLLFRVESFDIIEQRITNTSETDHGAFSAIIFLLHFYENGAIYKLSPYKSAAVELAALAIYNHTNKFGLQGEKDYHVYRPCFSSNPISYLLRICDDLQEWDRIYFVISDKPSLFFCGNCKTPITRYSEKNGEHWLTKYCCNCYSINNGKAKDTLNHNARLMPLFDGKSGFPYRRIYNVSVCDKLEAIASKSGKKICFKLHYDLYKLLYVTYLDATYAKYRSSDLNLLKKLFECQRGIPKIYLDYFVTSNPIHIKVNLLGEYLNMCYGKDDLKNGDQIENEKSPFESLENFNQWISKCVVWILEKTESIRNQFLENIVTEKEDSEGSSEAFREKIEKYLKMAMELYAKLLIYQWVNMYLNEQNSHSLLQSRMELYKKNKYILYSSEWEFVTGYFKSSELRCLIEDCFLQFTRMYFNIMDNDIFPTEYYEQYANGKREDIFVSKDWGTIDGCKDDITDSKKLFHESEEYYYKALACYFDMESYCPIADRKDYADVMDNKGVDAYTDLYLFYLMDEEIKKLENSNYIDGNGNFTAEILKELEKL